MLISNSIKNINNPISHYKNMILWRKIIITKTFKIKMLKLLLLVVTFFSHYFIQNAIADCPDEVLYCFDSNEKILGELFVGQY